MKEVKINFGLEIKITDDVSGIGDVDYMRQVVLSYIDNRALCNGYFCFKNETDGVELFKYGKMNYKGNNIQICNISCLTISSTGSYLFEASLLCCLH
jgi:hypothetical protein